MTDVHEKLSAYLDGELPETEAKEVEAALEADPALLAELEALMSADSFAKAEFAEMLDEPVPFDLAATIRNAPEGGSANLAAAPTGWGRWLAAAAVLIALVVGGAAGQRLGLSQGQQIAAAPGWLPDIADYHRVYADQVRHLVEVPAEESDHIKAWLGKTIGDTVPIPELGDQGLTFQGARLLVAAGKPVAQLMYLDADGQVVALCQIQTANVQSGFKTRTIGAFDMVTWGAGASNFVIVGDTGRADLDAIARAAAAQV